MKSLCLPMYLIGGLSHTDPVDKGEEVSLPVWFISLAGLSAVQCREL